MANTIVRRNLVGALISLVAWPLAARAQQPDRMRRIGVLMSNTASDPLTQTRETVFAQALKEFGWVEGRNLNIQYRFPGPEPAHLRSAVAELMSLAPDLILAANTPALAAVRKQTRTVPIIFLNVTDPVGQGFVESLAHPGGNVTGFTSFEFTMGGKWIEILKEVSPQVERIALIFNPVTAPYVQYYIRSFQAAAPRFAVELQPTPIHNADEIKFAIGSFASAPNGGMFVAPDLTTALHRDLIIALAAKYRLPTIYPYRFFAAGNGLISYGVDITDFFRRAAAYVDRIFKGADPGTLPVQQPVKLELVINLKTAKALELTVPLTLLALANAVIE